MTYSFKTALKTSGIVSSILLIATSPAPMAILDSRQRSFSSKILLRRPPSISLNRTRGTTQRHPSHDQSRLCAGSSSYCGSPTHALRILDPTIFHFLLMRTLIGDIDDALLGLHEMLGEDYSMIIIVLNDERINVRA